MRPRDPRLEALEVAVRGAAAIAMSHFGTVTATRKPDRSLVTQADLDVERYLVEHLGPVEPGARFLGEEGTADAVADEGQPTWAIDPIDGTAVFVAGLTTWSISVGLVQDDRVELGCVYLPVPDEMFLAGPDGPLEWNEAVVDPADRHQSSRPDGSFNREAWVAMPSDAHRRYTSRFPGKIRALGSIASHMAWVARGGATAMLAVGRLWDIAGGLACCRAAGIDVTYLSGQPVILKELVEGARTPEPIVAAHPADIAGVRAAFDWAPPKR